MILRGGRGAQNHGPDGVEQALEKLRAAGLPERVVVDASHDNSGKDAERQPEVAAEIGRQLEDGQRAIVGVMLESFLVAGRQDLVPGQAADLRPVDHRRLHGLGHHGRRAGRPGGLGARAARALPLMRIAVLGAGLIGGSIGQAARQNAGRGRGGGPRPLAPSGSSGRWPAGAIDCAAGSLAEALDGADACFCCAPVGALTGQVRDALAAAPADCVVTDVGSVKRALVETIEDERFVGGHPIAGAETSGVEHARPDLFEGALWYLTPTADSSGLLYERLHRLIVALGARPAAIDATTHDSLLAVVSHLPHVLANVLVAQAGSHTELPRIGPSFRDATRVAGANTGIWTDIYLANRSAIAEEIDAAAERLRAVADDLRAADGDALASWNEAARADRQRLLEAGQDGDTPIELGLTVPNRPGIVAQVALELGKAGVNIVDMALAPASDMRTGAMTLWIGGRDQADRARELIEGAWVRGDRAVSSVRFEPSGAIRGPVRPAGRQVDLAPRGAVRRHDRPAGVHPQLPQVGGHHLDARGAAVAGRRGRRERRPADDQGRGPARGAGGHRRASSTWATRARCCGCCRAGSPGRPAAGGALDGDESIRRRPVDRVVEPLRQMGGAGRRRARSASRRWWSAAPT